MKNSDPEILVSLPAACTAGTVRQSLKHTSACFIESDPPGVQLGSGGGTAWLLQRAWQNRGGNQSFSEWLRSGRKIIIHASGESRRLPGYAVTGKANLPLPLIPGRSGQTPNQVLLDLQTEMTERILRHAPQQYCLAIACGDVLLEWDNWLPEIPAADVLIVGLRASAEETSRHGALVCAEASPNTLDCFLQKPSVEKLNALDGSHQFALDTGIWLLSADAVDILMKQCEWDSSKDRFSKGDFPGRYDLYSQFGPALGNCPALNDAAINRLSAAILPLPEARFFHFGTQRSMLASTHRLLCPSHTQRSFDAAAMDMQTEPVILHSETDGSSAVNARFVWIENSCVPPTWRLNERHVITGIPANKWQLTLPPGICIDMVPLGNDEWCLRPYGFDDTFRGAVGDATTVWMDQPLTDWLTQRNLSLSECNFHADDDIQNTALFPVVKPDQSSAELLQWMIGPCDTETHELAELWQSLPRLSARDLLQQGRPDILLKQRNERLHTNLKNAGKQQWRDLLATTDLQKLAGQIDGTGFMPDCNADDLCAVHACMLRAAVEQEQRNEFETAAVDKLRQLMTGRMQQNAAAPRRGIIEDQIVWGRSPVRIDLAGGWTDTPPYCLENGGCVVNMAVDLNGQPPIQVFGRISPEPGIILRSIDLGLDQHITAYDELESAPRLGSGFGIAAAALQLAGLHPHYYKGQSAATLLEHMQQTLGGGIELTMLAAVPKGSGLGTSSILASTTLAVLSDMLDLKWSINDIFARTLVLEQILTSGGGWQDQAGGMYPGIKMVSTVAGVMQNHELRWLPGDMAGNAYANRRMLLYYTGITRTAHDILGQIVNGFFRNEAQRIRIVEDIAANAGFTADALQRNDWQALCTAINRSWILNRRLDSGTNPPAVNSIVEQIGTDAAALKLTGAGGGGFMLILAHDEAAGEHIKERLQKEPPNPRARFVDLSLSTTGLQVTRS